MKNMVSDYIHSLIWTGILTPHQFPTPVPDTGRTVIIWGSHMVRMAARWAASLDTSTEPVILATPGWVATPADIGALLNGLSKVRPNNKDTVVMDLLSNNVYMGSDEWGIPTKLVKLPSDNRYHVLGELQVAPEKVLRKILLECEPIFEACKEALVLFMVPFPR